MVTVNLRDFYYWYRHDEFVEVSDEMAAEMLAAKNHPGAYSRRARRHNATYSLDAGDGIEREACYINMTPHEILEHQLLRCAVCDALNSLPEPQGRRVDAHYLRGMTYQAIADIEGVDESAVRSAVKRGVRTMQNNLKEFF